MWNPFRRAARPTLDAVRFDTAGHAPLGETRPGQLRVWTTPDGDDIGLYFFPLPPNLPANAPSVDAFAASRHDSINAAGAKLVEHAVADVAGVRLIRLIIAVPQNLSGLTYVGSITIPFKAFSYVVKVQCPEHGLTGVREAMLFERHLADGGSPDVRPDFDSPAHDAEFPTHPLSRARRALAHVAGTLSIDPAIRALPRFALPRP